MFSKFLDPKNDLAFKRIFGNERNKDILIHFLNDIFGRTTNPIETVTFLPSTQSAEIAAQRVSIVDLLCHDAEGNKFIIEMQVAHEPGFEKRAQYYAAKTYIKQREKGVEYQDLQSVTFLAIMNFVLFPDKPAYLSHHVILDKNSLEQDLKGFSFSFLELPKFKKKKEQLLTMTEKWAYFFKRASQTTEDDLAGLIGDDLILGRAYEELNRFGWSEAELQDYDRADMKQSADRAILKGAEERGKNQGIEMGETKRAIEIAMKMLAKKRPLEEISEFTGLSIEELKKIFSQKNE
jgi:predicted transposase/invertase (TIGR01784 family)